MKKYILIDVNGIWVQELDLIDIDEALKKVRKFDLTVIDPISLKKLDINGHWVNI